jgi:hypothetical protein
MGPRHPSRNGNSRGCRDRSADRIRGAEEPSRLPFGKEDGERVFQDRGLVAPDEREGENLENLRVGPMDRFLDDVRFRDTDEDLRRFVDPHRRPDFRKIPNHGRRHGPGRYGEEIGPEIGVARLLLDDPVDVGGVGVITVVAELGPDEEHDDDENGHAHGQAEDVEARVGQISSDVSPGGGQIAFPHDETPKKQSPVSFRKTRRVLKRLRLLCEIP